MRRFDGAGSARSPGPRRHASCLHGDVADHHRYLAGFFTEGLQYGLRLAYVSSDGADAARAALAGLGDLDRRPAAGALRVLSARDVYGAGGPVDPERVVASVAAATEQALADGFRGLAVSADFEYVDHRLLLTLDAYGRGNGVALSLRSAPLLAARLMEVLPMVSLQLAKSGAQE